MGKLGKIITFSLQKGGVSKTTTCAITGFLLAKEGYKVLCIDFDSQGNLTYLLTQQSIYDFNGKTVLEAVKEANAEKYIISVKNLDNIDLLPSNDYLALFPKFLYEDYPKLRRSRNKINALKETIEPIRDQYDFILIDTPPSLSDQTFNALNASNYVVIPYGTDQFTYDALLPFYETVNHTHKNFNPDLQVAGILPRIIDIRVGETQEFLDKLDKHEVYGKHRFKTTISSGSQTRRLPMYGLAENKELNKAIKEYIPYVKELLQRVNP